jgi:hypothetical protein
MYIPQNRGLAIEDLPHHAETLVLLAKNSADVTPAKQKTSLSEVELS